MALGLAKSLITPERPLYSTYVGKGEIFQAPGLCRALH